MPRTKPLTTSDYLRAVRTPMIDVSMSLEGSLKVQVTGVREPFNFYVEADVVRDYAPFGNPTNQTAMRLAHELAQQMCAQRGLI